MPTSVRALLTLLLTILPLAVAAAEEKQYCRNGSFGASTGPLGQARVVAPGRTHFRDDNGACPNASPACEGSAYLVTDDMVLTAQSHDDYVCAFFPNKVGGSAGYLPRTALAFLPPLPPPTPADWDGVWGAGDNRLRITALHDGRLTVAGEAYWPGRKVNPKIVKFAVREGTIGGVGRPEGGRVVIGGPDEGCILTLRLLGRHLLAGDNGVCGPPNVSFTGVYQPVSAVPNPFQEARTLMEHELNSALEQIVSDPLGSHYLLKGGYSMLRGLFTPALVDALQRQEKALVAAACGGRYRPGVICGFDYDPLTCGHDYPRVRHFRTTLANADVAHITVAWATRPRDIIGHYRLVRRDDEWRIDAIDCGKGERFNWR